MDWLSRILAPLAAYPRWLVITCVVLVALGIGWVLVKVVKWTIYLVILLVMLALVLGVVAWLLG